MCLSTVYMKSGNEQKEIMKDVARIEAEDRGFWLIDLFGEKRFIEASIQAIDLLDGRFVMLNENSPDHQSPNHPLPSSSMTERSI